MRVGPLGLPELLLILAVLLLIFGARRLPEIGSSLGRGIRSFKSSVTGEDEAEQRPPEEKRPISSASNTDDLA
ncbi:MAG TPA: twin-arginine translocase TatA/TatE family subunit [Dehalococcoidia bacterium]|nr:twin-arginine translocase TatA/TatE family subunit [Dehalococcoidia bacterium]